MDSLKLNEQGDLEFDGQGNLVVISGTEEFAQSLRIALETRLGEFFLDTNHGLSYGQIQRKNPNLARVRAEVLKTVYQDPRTKEVESIKLDYDPTGRRISIRFMVHTVDGVLLQGEEEVIVG